MNLKRALTVFGILALLLLLNFLVNSNPGLAAKVTDTLTTQSPSEYAPEPDQPMLDYALEKTNEGLTKFFAFTGFRNATQGNLIMILVGLIFIYLAIRYDYEPLLLIPIGTGIIIGNIPFFQDGGVNLQLGIYQEGSVLNYLYFGVTKGIYPPLIFLGIGAMTDFSSLISNPRLILLGAAAQIGIFMTFLGALYVGFNMPEAGSIGIIGGADGPTAIFLASKLANGGIVHGYETHCHRCLFLYGPCSGHSTAHHEAAHQSPRTTDTHEAPPLGVKTRENIVPHCGPHPYHLHLTRRSAAPRHVVLWKHSQRKRGYKTSGRNSPQLNDRHCYYTARTHRWCLHTSRCVPYQYIHTDLWFGCCEFYGCHCRWCSVCQSDESVSVCRKQD